MRKCIVLFAAMAFVVAFTLPAYAAEWSFYGSARVATFWEDKSEEIGATCDSDLDFNQYLHGNSRFGANVKADDISGQVEFGMGANASVSNRIIWGEYDFGMLKLGIGQTYSPTNFFISNQVWAGDANMLGTGGIYSGRNPMVRFRFGSLDVAFVKPDTPGLEECGTNGCECTDEIELDTDGDGEIDVTLGPSDLMEPFAWDTDGDGEYDKFVCYSDSPCTTGITSDTDVKFPRIEARYLFQMAGVTLELGGAWQTYDVVAKVDSDGSTCVDCEDFADEEKEEITSWFGYLGGKYSAGPFTFGGDIWYAQNPGNMGMGFGMPGQDADDAGSPGADYAAYDEDSGKIEDTAGFGYLLVGAFSPSDMLTFEAGWGQTTYDNDTYGDKDDTAAYYVQARIQLAKGVWLVPEVGKIDYKQNIDEEDEGDVTYYGAKWQINF